MWQRNKWLWDYTSCNFSIVNNMEKNEITITEITNQLMSLKDSGVVGIKQSFEDEGVILEDVLKIKRLCDKLDLKLNVKIGGCEAVTDINNCLSLETSGIVAPMVESEFALEKFVESIISNTNDQDRSLIDFFINIESKSAIQNLDKILSSPSSKLLKGIVVGRSDLTKSFGYGKQDVNSKEICEIVKNTFKEAKSFNFTTIMGGNIGHSSTSFIEELVVDNLLDKIETRNVIVDLSKSGTKDMDDLLKNALLFESQWMQYKAQFYNDIGESYIKRSKTILDRIS